MGFEDQVKSLGNSIGEQLIDQSKEFLNSVKEEDKEFFKDLGMRYARNYLTLKLGEEDDKAEARENIEALTMAAGSRVQSRALDAVEHGKEQIATIVRSVGKTLLSLAMATIV